MWMCETKINKIITKNIRQLDMSGGLLKLMYLVTGKYRDYITFSKKYCSVLVIYSVLRRDAGNL